MHNHHQQRWMNKKIRREKRTKKEEGRVTGEAEGSEKEGQVEKERQRDKREFSTVLSLEPSQPRLIPAAPAP